MFWERGNRDTTKATAARRRDITVLRGGNIQGFFHSLKECSERMGVPSSRICEYAKSGRVYRGGLQFIYGRE